MIMSTHTAPLNTPSHTHIDFGRFHLVKVFMHFIRSVMSCGRRQASGGRRQAAGEVSATVGTSICEVGICGSPGASMYAVVAWDTDV